MAFVVSGALLSLTLSEYDDQIANDLQNNSVFGSKVNTTAEIMGEFYVVDSAALLTYAIGHFTHNKKIKQTGEVLVEALILTEAGTFATKAIARRQRPNGDSWSFSSGHAARFFAIATVLETLHGPAYGIPAYIISGLMSYSMIDQRAHYLSDVIFGAAWGTAVGWGTARFHKKLYNDKYAIIPSCQGKPGVQIIYRF